MIDQPALLEVAENKHPCQYSPEVLVILARFIRPGTHVHDPFAGPGLRLGALCDRRGATFSGTDTDDYGVRDHRVALGDSRDPATYPPGAFVVVTSPVYVTKRCADYANGPTPTTKIKGRRDYGIAKGAPLSPANLARFTGRPSKVADYWAGHGEAVEHWGDEVVVNVDEPIGDDWAALLIDHGYRVHEIIPAYTRRYRGLANAEVRADHEVVIVARREG